VLVCALPFLVLGTWIYSELDARAIGTVLGLVAIASVPLRRALNRRQMALGRTGLALGSTVFGLASGLTSGVGVINVSLLLGTGMSGQAVLATDALISVALDLCKAALFQRFALLDQQTAITGVVIGFCLLNHAHYLTIRRKIDAADEALSWLDYPEVANPPQVDSTQHTAVFAVGSSRSGGVHALQWVRQEFPDHFRNFVFMNARAVDAQSYGGSQNLEQMRQKATTALNYFVNFCHHDGLPARAYLAFGTDPIEELIKLAERVHQDFPNSIFFTSKLIFERDNWYIRQLHSEAALTMLRQLHLRNLPMVILPMKL